MDKRNYPLGINVLLNTEEEFRSFSLIDQAYKSSPNLTDYFKLIFLVTKYNSTEKNSFV